MSHEQPTSGGSGGSQKLPRTYVLVVRTKVLAQSKQEAESAAVRALEGSSWDWQLVRCTRASTGHEGRW